MASPTILVVSADKDFAQPLAEQVKKELSLDCRIAESPESIRSAGNVALVVASEPQSDYTGKQLVAKKPVRLSELLSEISQALQTPGAEEAKVIGAYRLLLRSKQLAYRSKQAALTDKEIALLQSLASGHKSREALLKEVWGIEAVLDTHTLETHIYRLRGKFRELSGEEVIAAAAGGYELRL